PALEAVLRDVHEARADRIVIGGDTVPGPMPRETLDRLFALDLPVQFIHRNFERSALAPMGALRGEPGSYWGTTSGRPLPERDLEVMRWTARQLTADDERRFASWPLTLRLTIPGVGEVLFCHGTPRSETEIFTRQTPEERLRPLFDPLGVAL